MREPVATRCVLIRRVRREVDRCAGFVRQTPMEKRWTGRYRRGARGRLAEAR